MEMQIIDSTS